MLKWLRERLSHKLEHLRWSKIKSILREYGLALVIIIVGWEIIEDVIFPMLFVFLGNHVHPAFYSGVPAAWLLCSHWLVVPLVWSWWVKMSGKENEAALEHEPCNHHHEE